MRGRVQGTVGSHVWLFVLSPCFFPPVCGFTSAAQLLVNPSSAFPSPSEAEDYREYLSGFFFASAASHPNVHQRENIVPGGVEGEGGGHTSGGPPSSAS